jgi:Ser/Thr protein kinase RdoA (MazF antagonist)
MNNIQFTQSELIWLATLRKETGLPIPEPVPTLGGRLLIRISVPGVPQCEVVSLLHWVDGKHPVEKIFPLNMLAPGLN